MMSYERADASWRYPAPLGILPTSELGKRFVTDGRSPGLRNVIVVKWFLLYLVFKPCVRVLSREHILCLRVY